MQNLKQRTKTVALVAAMALMLSPFVASAQGGGLFGLGKTPTETTENGGIMNRSGTGGYNLNNQQFGRKPRWVVESPSLCWQVRAMPQ